MKKGTTKSLMTFLALLLPCLSLALTVAPTVTDQNPLVPYSGSVSVSIAGGTPPYTFHGFGDTIVYPGDTIVFFDSIGAGTYLLNVTDAASGSASVDAVVLYSIAWRNTVNVTTGAHSIQRPNYGDYDAGAFSYNYFKGGTDGYFEFRVPNVTTNTRYSIGLAYEDYNTSYYSFAYGFSQNAATVTLQYRGQPIVGLNQTAAVNDRFRVERVGGDVRYYKNGTLIHTISDVADYDRDLYLDVSISRTIVALDGIRASFGVPFNAYETVAHLTVEGHESGGIDLNVLGGNAPYSYAWADGPTTATRSNLAKGTYTVTVTDNASNTVTRTFELGYQIGWIDPVGAVTTSPHGIYRTGPPNTSGGSWPYYMDMGASSANTLPKGADGYLEFTTPFHTPSSQLMGLSVYDIGSDRFSSRHAFLFSSTGFTILVNSMVVASGNHTLGDVFRIERAGTAVKYYKNGVEIWEDEDDNQVTLMVEAHFQTTGFEFDNIRTDFGLAYGIYPSIVHCTPGAAADGTADLNIKGSTAPYTAAWSDGGTGTARTGLSAGIYTVTVTDAASNTVTGTLEIGYKFAWQNAVNVTGYDHALVKTGGSAHNYSFDAGAVTQNTLRPNTDGYVSFVCKQPGRTDVFAINAGFSREDYSTAANQIKYGFVMYNRTVSVFIQQNTPVADIPIKIGDELRMSREGGSLKFYKNGHLLHTATVDPTETLIFDNSLRSNQLWQLRTNIGIDFNIYTEVTHLAATDHASGGIDPNVKGGVAPYTYAWSDGSTSAIRTGLAAGGYTVTVTDANGATVAQTIDVGYRVLWTNPVTVATGDHRIDRLDGYTTTFNAGASSRNLLPPNTDGYVQFDVPTNGLRFYVGLSKQDYGLYEVTQRYAYRIYDAVAAPANNGTALITPLGLDRGDRFRISREGSLLKYYKNGTEIHSYTVDPAESLVLDVAMYRGYVERLVLSFGARLGGYGTVTHDDPSDPGTAAIDLSAFGGAAPYAYQWGDGGTTAARTGLGAGTHSVTVTDANGASVAESYTVHYKINWQNTSMVSTSPNGITRSTGGNNWNAGASSVEKIGAYQNGFVEFEYSLSQNSMVFGLSETDPGTHFSSIKYGLMVNSSTVMIYESNVLKGTYGAALVGDRFRIAREGAQIKYYRNGQVIHTSSTDDSKELLLDCSIYGSTHGAIVHIPVTASFGAPLTVSGSVTGISGGSASNGSVALAVSGGLGPYSYAWSNSATTQDLTGLTIGSYTVTVTDVLGKTATNSFSVINDQELYWTGADDDDWHNPLNWSWLPCGPSADTIPDSTMTVIFTGCDSIQARLAANATVQRFVYGVGTPYFVNEGSYTLTVLEEVLFDGAEMSLTSGSISFGSGIGFQGGAFNISGGATLNVNGNISGTGATITLDGNISATGNIVLSSGSLIGKGAITTGELTLREGGGLFIEGGNLSLHGNLTIDNGNIGMGSEGFTVSGNAHVTGESSIRLADGIVSIGGGFSQSGGYFQGNAASVSVGGNFVVAGGTFISTTEQLTVSGNFNVAGTVFQHNEGTVVLLGDEKEIDLGMDLSSQDVLVGSSNVIPNNTGENVELTIGDDGTVTIAPVKDVTIDGVNTLDPPLLNGVPITDAGFFNLTLGNSSNTKIFTGDVLVNGTMDFDGDYLDLAGNSLTINNKATTALTYTSGGILAGGSMPGSWLKWNVGEETGEYMIPMVNALGEHLDLSFDITTAGTRTDEMLEPFISVSSFATNSSMEPYAEGVTYWYNENGDIDFTNIVPRVWQLQAGNYSALPVGNIELKYTDTDIQGIPFPESSLKIQSWMVDGWEEAEGVVSASTNTASVSSRVFNGSMVLVNGSTFLLGKLTTVSYATLAEELDGGYYHSMNGKLYYRYDNSYSDGLVAVKIYDWKRDLELNTNVIMQHGTNWAEIHLIGLGLTEGSFYILEVTDQKGRTTKLRFKYVIDVIISIRPSPFEPVAVDDGGGGGG